MLNMTEPFIECQGYAASFISQAYLFCNQILHFFHLQNYAFPNLIQASLSLLFSKRNLSNKNHHNTTKISLNDLCTLPTKKLPR